MLLNFPIVFWNVVNEDLTDAAGVFNVTLLVSLVTLLIFG
jgi:hypothetical protein